MVTSGPTLTTLCPASCPCSWSHSSSTHVFNCGCGLLKTSVRHLGPNKSLVQGLLSVLIALAEPNVCRDNPEVKHGLNCIWQLWRSSFLSGGGSQRHPYLLWVAKHLVPPCKGGPELLRLGVMQEKRQQVWRGGTHNPAFCRFPLDWHGREMELGQHHVPRGWGDPTASGPSNSSLCFSEGLLVGLVLILNIYLYPDWQLLSHIHFVQRHP